MIVPTLEREETLWNAGKIHVAGLDEVGRGPLAGPVVASVVVFRPGQCHIEGLRDSKLLGAEERSELFDRITTCSLGWSVGAASASEIDRINIRKATALAMRRALRRLPFAPQHLFVDGLPFPELGCAHESIVSGDAVCQSIAAASVIAKVVRDRLMVKLHCRYPEFHWETNKGYYTEEHVAAINEWGPSPHHRFTFDPILQLSLFQ